VHSNGLGQSYYDCFSLNQHTSLQAQAAALAWSPGSPLVGSAPIPSCTSDPYCLCAQSSTQSAIWCYAGSQTGREGRVAVTSTSNCFAALCPSASSGLDWN
jgi:hypothetical protein